MPIPKIYFDFQEHGIEVMTGIEVVGLDSSLKVLKLSSGADLRYSNVFICTGGT